MNIRDIQAFVTAVDLGSIQRAAARLHLTQPGISRRIQALESTLSLELLDRRAKPVRPSGSGLHILAACRQVLQAAKTIQLLALPNGEPAGEFRLGIAPGLDPSEGEEKRSFRRTASAKTANLGRQRAATSALEVGHRSSSTEARQV